MQTNTVTVGLLLSALVASVIGTLDAAISDEPDLVAVLAFIALLQLVLLIRLAAARGARSPCEPICGRGCTTAPSAQATGPSRSPIGR